MVKKPRYTAKKECGKQVKNILSEYSFEPVGGSLFQIASSYTENFKISTSVVNIEFQFGKNKKFGRYLGSKSHIITVFQTVNNQQIPFLHMAHNANVPYASVFDYVCYYVTDVNCTNISNNCERCSYFKRVFEDRELYGSDKI